MDVINEYGADATQIYLINSPSSWSRRMRFNEDGICVSC
jgi:hypothetical protein